MAPDLLIRLASGGFMKNSNNTFKALLLLTVLAMLSACAKGTPEANSNFSSNLPDPNAEKPVAYCNSATKNNTSVKLKVYTDAAKNIRTDYMYAKFSEVPSTFGTGVSYISMWKWQATGAATPSLDSTALKFMLLNPKSGLAITNWISILNWADVKSAATQMGHSDAISFLNAVILVIDLKDQSGAYQALKISHYASTTQKAISDIDLLLPAFHANPADYALEGSTGSQRASVLKNLHPFAYNSGLTSAQYGTLAQSLCF